MRKLIIQEMINKRIGKFFQSDYDSFNDLFKTNRTLAMKMLEKNIETILNDDIKPIVKKQCSSSENKQCG